MSERSERLEMQLTRLRPRALAVGFAERVQARLTRATASRRGDRLLIFTMSCGGLAACRIAGMLLSGSSSPRAMPPDWTAQSAPPRLGDYPQAIAQTDGRWKFESK